MRERQKRNFIATLFLSLGVPLLLAGDEFGRTQRGNNNAYCQDNEISWVDWNGRSERDLIFGQFVKAILRMRREHPAFARDRFFTGRPQPGSTRPDISWYTPAGHEMTGEDWRNDGHSIGVFFGDRPMLAVLFNAAGHDVEFTLPDTASVLWHLLLDTAFDERGEAPLDGPMTSFTVRAHSTAVFNGLPA